MICNNTSTYECILKIDFNMEKNEYMKINILLYEILFLIMHLKCFISVLHLLFVNFHFYTTCEQRYTQLTKYDIIKHIS